ncbi:polysaccharide biosynthesis protein [Mariniflexile sp.]
MGMSKLIAENYIVQLSQKSGTQFSITRFGNIMGVQWFRTASF